MAGRQGWTAASMAFALLIVWIVCCSWGNLGVVAFPHYRRGSMTMTDLQRHVEFLDKNMTVTDLQRHVEFFDKNKDGVITLTESTQGFTEIGFPAGFAAASATATNGAFGPLTTPLGKIPSTNIYIKNINKAIHGSDTGAYNENGAFVPENFEKIFKEHAHKKADALSLSELRDMLDANREILNPASWTPAEVEWDLAYKLGMDDEGFLHKDILKGIYDGTTFYKFANESRFALHSDA